MSTDVTRSTCALLGGDFPRGCQRSTAERCEPMRTTLKPVRMATGRVALDPTLSMPLQRVLEASRFTKMCKFGMTYPKESLSGAMSEDAHSRVEGALHAMNGRRCSLIVLSSNISREAVPIAGHRLMIDGKLSFQDDLLGSYKRTSSFPFKDLHEFPRCCHKTSSHNQRSTCPLREAEVLRSKYQVLSCSYLSNTTD